MHRIYGRRPSPTKGDGAATGGEVGYVQRLPLSEVLKASGLASEIGSGWKRGTQL